MRLSDNPIQPILKTRSVSLDPVATFALFTTRMETWWPLQTHSIAQSKASGIRFEPHIGGRVVELTADGTEHPWADVIAWDPPHRFVLAWHPSLEPVAATILEVRFRLLADGGTQIDLEHRGWEELGAENGQATRDGYDPGWDSVLEPFGQVSENLTPT